MVRRLKVLLGQDDYVLLFSQGRAVLLDLDSKPIVSGLWILGIDGDQEGQHPGTLHVLKKLEAESFPLVGALDDAGNVGHDKGPMSREAHHAKVGLERGKR